MTHSALVLLPKPPDVQAQSLALAQQVIRAVPAASAEYVEEFLRVTSRYLTHSVAVPKIPHLANCELAKLTLEESQHAYWSELDSIIRAVRAYAFQVATTRLRFVLEASDAASRAAATRLLIELAVWCAYFQYGLTCAWNVVSRDISNLDVEAVLCGDLERYIRGAIAVDFARVDGGAASMGIAQQTPEPSDYVDEFDAAFRKQVEGVAFAAQQLARNAGPADLPDLVTRLHKAYKFCCSLTHVTPVLFAAAAQPTAIDAECAPVLLNGCAMALGLLDGLFFDPRFDVVTFEVLVSSRPTPRRRAMVNLQLDFLRAMIRKNDPVVFEMASGSKFVVYKP